MAGQADLKKFLLASLDAATSQYRTPVVMIVVGLAMASVAGLDGQCPRDKNPSAGDKSLPRREVLSARNGRGPAIVSVLGLNHRFQELCILRWISRLGELFALVDSPAALAVSRTTRRVSRRFGQPETSVVGIRVCASRSRTQRSNSGPRPSAPAPRGPARPARR